MAKAAIVNASGEEIKPQCPKVKAVHPFGSRILIDVLKADEVLGTNLYVSDNTNLDGAPQAYVVELGPQVPADSGIEVGMRIYWEGKGTPVQDPRETNGRIRALLEIHNVKAIIEE